MIGVLLDTFVIRTMLVPAIMVHLGKHNWWPRKLLPPTLGDSPPPSAATASSTTADVGALLDKGSNSAAADPYAAYRTGSE